MKKEKKEKKKSLLVQIDKKVLEQLRKTAEQEGVSMSFIVRKILKEYFKPHKVTEKTTEFNLSTGKVQEDE